MSDPLLADQVNMTPNRLRWLRRLATLGPCTWSQMPKQANDRRSSTHMTWRPLERAGLITAEWKEINGINDWTFAITDEGRKYL